MDKIAICATGHSPMSLLDNGLEQCHCIMIWDPECSGYEPVFTHYCNGKEDLTNLINTLIAKEVQCVITKCISTDVYQTLKNNGIKVYAAGSDNVEDTLQQFLIGNLDELPAEHK